MKTTLDLPDRLMLQVKNRAASEGRATEDLVADFIRLGLSRPAKDEKPYYRHLQSGFLISRPLGNTSVKKVTLAESLAAIEQANEEDALSRAGFPR